MLAISLGNCTRDRYTPETWRCLKRLALISYDSIFTSSAGLTSCQPDTETLAEMREVSCSFVGGPQRAAHLLHLQEQVHL